MSRRTKTTLSLLVFSLLVLSAACRKKETTTTAAGPTIEPAVAATPAPSVQITDVQLGKSLGPDKKVESPTDAFAPKDTIFLSVGTDGTAPAAVMRVKWTYQDGQTVKEDSKTLVLSGPAVTEFSIQKPGGWPAGTYNVEVSLDGQPATTRSFRVG
jgi:hypothetical protein